ncbi:hypothetical protein [Flavobacterium sp.]|uniref:hypothetical protein n=1 Tax=Flavobacterium sp. TaxID=239 RepID=UPI0028BD22EE|nr:hypothetical protein [Flavobacterium sp.]
MKKIFLLLTFISLGILSSCSSDDGGSGGGSGDSMKMKINGTQKSFTSVDVDSMVYPDYTDLEVTATIAGSPPTTIEMNLEKDSMEGVYFFQYSDAGVYYETTESFSVIITQNSDNKLKGTFSGTLVDSGNPANTIVITEGSFNITY